MLNPRVSVIMPVYNRAGLVKRAIESVLAQDFPAFELIVVDDGSTDNTYETVGSIKDPRIRCFKQENGGPANARNHGIREARGEYIAFLDSDDVWNKEHLEILVSYLDEHRDIGLVYSKLLLVQEGAKEDKWVFGEDYDKNKFEYHCFIIPSSLLLRKNCLDKVGLLDENPAIRQTSEDWEFLLRFSDYYSISSIDKVTVTGYKYADGLAFTALKDKSAFKGFLYLFTKRLNHYKPTPRREKVAPFDGYYFYQFTELFKLVSEWHPQKEQFAAILKEEILPLFEKLKELDPLNLEARLILTILYSLIGNDQKIVEIGKDSQNLLGQELEINENPLLKLAASSLKVIASKLEKAGEKESAEKFYQKMRGLSAKSNPQPPQSP